MFDFNQLFQQQSLVGDGALKIDAWHPKEVVPFDIVIDKNGTWFHEGVQIENTKILVFLSKLLRFNAGHYFLITPTQAYQIKVEDVPFVIDSLVENNLGSFFVTNQNDLVIIDQNMNIKLKDFFGIQLPYVDIRDNLLARVSRNCYYQLIDEAIQQGREDCVVINKQVIPLA